MVVVQNPAAVVPHDDIDTQLLHFTSQVLYGIQEFLEEHSITAHLYVRRSSKSYTFKRNSPHCWLEVSRREDVLKVLKKCLPYMWIKDEKAHIAIQIITASLDKYGKAWQCRS